MVRRSHVILAQADAIAPIFLWLFVLIGLLLIAGAGVLWLRRWYRTDETAAPIGFTLGDLRRLHREGQMTDEEFERAKAQIIAGARRALERDASESATSPSETGESHIEYKPPPDDELR